MEAKRRGPFPRDDLVQDFENHISQEQYRVLLAMDPPLPRDCEERVATLLFSDLRGFGDLVDPMPPAEQGEFLSGYLGAIASIIIRHGGYVDKFLGDAVMAVFGAPLPCDEAEGARRACLAALEIAAWSRSQGLETGLGIATGPVAVGDFGIEGYPHYSAMGRVVNLASFLEGESRRTSLSIAVSERTRSLLGPAFRAPRLGEVNPRSHKAGAAGQLRVFTLVGLEEGLDWPTRQAWDRYEHGMLHLEAGRGDEAIHDLAHLAAERPDERLFGHALDEAQRRMAEAARADLAAAPSTAAALALLADRCNRVFGRSELAYLVPGEDGLWRFLDEAPLLAPSVVFSPEGDAIAWARGLRGAARLDAELLAADKLPAAAAEALLATGFSVAAPGHRRNELCGVLFFRTVPETSPDQNDAALVEALAEAFAAQHAELRLAEWRERYRAKAGDAEKLEESNRELESQSVRLQKALDDVRSLNANLESIVREQVGKLERAIKLKRYLPPNLVEEIIDGGREVAPALERRKITVFFSDVHGFTNATDAMEAEDLARLLNEYLSAMSGIAFRHGGTIDKFRGDGMMILFGAPAPLPPAESAKACVRMAVEMCRRVEELKAKWDYEGFEWQLGVRMGINTGYATVGEFGCEQRMDYTAIGGEVNLASRLENACGEDCIVVSHATMALIRDEFECVPMGEISVKGISRPVRVYQVPWRGGNPPPDLGGEADN